MGRVVGRWSAGNGHWHEGPCFELVLEQASGKWVLTYFEHGEVHARTGFDTEEDAHGDLGWLMDRIPAEYQPWRAS
ncbi:hypothetical protein OU415_00595 [Saccharopolyspora sp. WRP15-2]|uniref:Uncharacterized protein n=1 Tax=Saccharopolyspora oryzae TaxID=2997343 RepID=A0ABT4UQA8_9PSEU|nr:hypothetical protein [Saccharopolyspora oryzae]MDA3623909.1 hypothetical protein [Saccharopolyspora oryzae]